MKKRARHPIDKKRMWLLIALTCGLAAAAATSVFAVSWRGHGPPARPRAAIVDQLAITDPNPDFVAAAERILGDAGYDVDYYASEEVTVEFYRGLATHGHRLIVLRSHSSSVLRGVTRNMNGQPVVVTERQQAGLFTNEPYSQLRHVREQKLVQLMDTSYPDFPKLGHHFGISPEFITSSVRGNFRGATIILMGCAGLQNDTLAKAFVSKGARSFISWSDSVTAEHTDASTENLLRHLVAEGMAPKEAVAKTMSEVGPDPAFDSSLLAYP